MDFFGPFSWVLISLLAILMGALMGAFSEWLKFKTKQQKLGTSTRGLEDQVVQLERVLQAARADRDALAWRLENIETIASQAWDALHEPSASCQVAYGATLGSRYLNRMRARLMPAAAHRWPAVCADGFTHG